MDLKRIKIKISLLLILMLVFWLAGSSFLHASDNESIKKTAVFPSFVKNILKSVKAFIDNIKFIISNRGMQSSERNRETEGSEKLEEELVGKNNNKKYKFGEEISETARGLKTGETTVEELVERANSIHIKVLEDVLEKVPEPAKSSIQKAMDNSNKGDGKATDAINNNQNSNNGKNGSQEKHKDRHGSKGLDDASKIGMDMKNNNPNK